MGGDEGSGTRSSLLYETLRIVTKLKPKYVLWENVPDIVEGDIDQNFKNYLKIMKQLGYTNYYKKLIASDYGIPQARERVFVLSIFGNEYFEFPKIKILTKSYKDYLEPTYNVDKVVLSEDNLMLLKDFNKNKHGGAGSIIIGDVYNTILAGYGKVSGYSGKIPCKEGYRILTPKECWRLMGFDDEDYEKASQVISEKALYERAGNSIVVNVLEAILKCVFFTYKRSYRKYNYNYMMDYIIRGLLSKKEMDLNGKVTAKDNWTNNGTVFVTIENYKNLEHFLSKDKFKKGSITQSAVRLLEMAILEATEEHFVISRTKHLEIDVNTILTTLGKDTSDNKKREQEKASIIKQIKKDLQVLKSVKIKFRGPTGDYITTGICTNTTRIENNTLHFVFCDEIFRLMKNDSGEIYLPLDMLRIDEKKHPNTYLLYKKVIAELGTSNEARIRVKDLYEYDVTLPRYELEDGAKASKPSENIITPFERDLGIAKEFKWEYEKTGKNKWKQPGANDRTPFEEWLNASIIVTRKRKLHFRTNRVVAKELKGCKKTLDNIKERR